MWGPTFVRSAFISFSVFAFFLYLFDVDGAWLCPFTHTAAHLHFSFHPRHVWIRTFLLSTQHETSGPNVEENPKRDAVGCSFRKGISFEVRILPKVHVRDKCRYKHFYLKHTHLSYSQCNMLIMQIQYQCVTPMSSTFYAPLDSLLLSEDLFMWLMSHFCHFEVRNNPRK